jgi:hypothetical protein
MRTAGTSRLYIIAPASRRRTPGRPPRADAAHADRPLRTSSIQRLARRCSFSSRHRRRRHPAAATNGATPKWVRGELAVGRRPVRLRN